MNIKVVIFLGFLCLKLKKSLSQEAGAETYTTLASNPVSIPKGGDSQTTTNEPSETPINEYNVLQMDSDIERSSHVHNHGHVDPKFKGFWTKRFVWRPRWVKTWQEKKMYIAVWKRMWGPVVVKEWVPVPKPPPGWVNHDSGASSYVIKKLHGK